MYALNRIVYYDECGNLRTDETQRLLGIAAVNLADLNVAVVQLREETRVICSNALVSV